MPQAAAVWVGGTVFSVTGSVAATNIAMAAAYAATTIAITSALSAVSKQLAPTPKGLGAITQEFSGTVEPRRIIYGELRISGMNVIPPFCTDVDGKYLQQILALAGHPVNDIGTVYFNDTAIADGSIGAVTGSSNDGLVSAGAYKDIAWIRRYDGTQTSVDYILDNWPEINTAWTSTDIGYGIPYIALQFKFKNDPYAKEGKPTVSCEVQGKKVYDPRLDSTNGGSGTHRYDDDATWEYSDNPALCLADYLMDSSLGMGEDPTRIDWTTVAVAANECDEVVFVPTGSSPEATTQNRYRCNIVLDVTARYEDNIEALCDTMMGHCYYSSGKWQIYAGAWSTAAFDLTEDDILGNVSIQTDVPRTQKFNAVRGQYRDSLRQYMPSEFKPITNSTYETEDGERIWREIELIGVTNEYQAQRLAILVSRRGRNVVTVKADFGMSAFKIRPYETGTLTLSEIGWDEQPVRCTGWEFLPEGLVRLTLVEEASTDWADPAVGDYTYVAGASNPSPSGYTPPAPTSLTATPVTNGVLLTWEIDETPPGTFFQVFREGDSSLSSPATPSLLATTYGLSYLDPTTGSNTYYYWVRAVSPSGTPGAIYPTGAGVSGTGTGVTGSGGESVKLIFQRSATQPSTPSPSTTVPGGWSADSNIAQTSPETPLWVSTGTRIEASPENNWVWQTPVQFEGSDGADGASGTDGNTKVVLNIYKRASSAPSTPTGGSYTFGTPDTFTPPTGWAPAVPSGSDPCYISTGTASITGTTGTDSSITWSTPVIAFQDGAPAVTTFYVTAPNLYKQNSGSAASGIVTSDAATINEFNGTATYSYAWAHLSTTSGSTPSISNSAIEGPTFSTTVTDGTDSISFWRCVVVDSESPVQIAAVDVRVQLVWIDLR